MQFRRTTVLSACVAVLAASLSTWALAPSASAAQCVGPVFQGATIDRSEVAVPIGGPAVTVTITMHVTDDCTGNGFSGPSHGSFAKVGTGLDLSPQGLVSGTKADDVWAMTVQIDEDTPGGNYRIYQTKLWDSYAPIVYVTTAPMLHVTAMTAPPRSGELPKAAVPTGSDVSWRTYWSSSLGSTPITLAQAPSAVGPWRHVNSFVTGEGGDLAVKVRPRSTTFYRLGYAGDADNTPVSVVIKVVASRGVSIRTASSVVARRPLTVSGVVTPRAAGVRLLIEARPQEPRGARWSIVGHAVTGKNGSYKAVVKPVRSSDYRVVALANAQNASGSSYEASVFVGNTSDGHGGAMNCKRVGKVRVCAGPGGFGVG